MVDLTSILTQQGTSASPKEGETYTEVSPKNPMIGDFYHPRGYSPLVTLPLLIILAVGVYKLTKEILKPNPSTQH